MNDFIIIGGGPAGSTCATKLSKKGYKVTLFEKEKFPRAHVGESLLPFCYNIFKDLGVLEEMEKRFVRKPGVQFTDAKGKNKTTYCFSHILDGPDYLSFHVRRSEFDKMLLDNSIKNGVEVHEETRVKNVDLSNQDSVNITTINSEGKEIVHEAKFLIDASGRDTFVAAKKKTRVPIKGLERTAFHAHWDVDSMPKGILSEGILRIAYLGGEKQGWIWCIPNDTKRISVGVVLNSAYVNNFRKNFNGDKKNWQNELYLSELKSAGTIWEFLKDADRATQVWVNGDYSYFSTEKYGSNFAMVGDSGQFIDPIFASGVFIALKSAELVTDALDKKFKNGDTKALSRVFEENIANAYEIVARFIKIYYNPEALDLHQFRKYDDSSMQEHKTAFAIVHYLLAGNFFEKAKEYKDFLDSIEDPKIFNRWSNLTKFTPEEQGHSCGMKPKEIFIGVN